MEKKYFKIARESTAVSEVIGTILLLGIAVSLFSIVYISVLSVPSSPPTPSANIVCTIRGNNIVFEHYGGDSLDPSTSLIVESGESRYQTTLENLSLISQWDSNGDKLWSFGEQLTISASLLGQQSAEISVIDSRSNSIIMMGNLPASNPLFTFINPLVSIQSTSPIAITATSSGVEPDNITLWYRWNGDWIDSFEENDILVSNYNNMSFAASDYVEVLGGGSGTDFIDYIDNQDVAIDGINDIGSHSDFSAQKQGPDGSYDILTEMSSTNEILIDSSWGADVSDYGSSFPSDGEDFLGKSSYGKYRIVNLFELDALPSSATINNLELIFTVLESGQSNHRLDVCPYNGDGQAYPQFDWSSVMYDRCRAGTQYVDNDPSCRTTGTKTLNLGNQAIIDLMQAKTDVNRFSLGFSEQGDNSDYAEIGEYSDIPNNPKLSITYEGGNYDFNAQCSWQNVNYQNTNEELCIKTGSLGSELLYVDIWNATTTAWDESVLTLQPNTWNNVSINPWLIDSTFIIRYRAQEDSGDTHLDTWYIDAALLHLWQLGEPASKSGNLTSTLITKPAGVSWQNFYVDVNNTHNSSFSLLDSNKAILLAQMENGANISDISEDSVYLYGSFNASVRLNSWKITLDGEDWQSYIPIDEDGSDGWQWTNFNFKTVDHGFSLDYYFYSIAKKDGWTDESAPNPYDATCRYEP